MFSVLTLYVESTEDRLIHVEQTAENDLIKQKRRIGRERQ